MDFDGISAIGTDFFLGVPADGERSLCLKLGNEEKLSLGHIACGKFSAAGAIYEKFRSHESNDALADELETEAVIPFGCEYRIRRTIQCADGFALITNDVRAENRGIIRALSLEDVVISGNPVSLSFLLPGEEKLQEFTSLQPGQIAYDGKLPVLYLRAVYADGSEAEFHTGEDLWRHQCAQNYPDCDSRFLLERTPDGAKLSRKMFEFPEDAEVAPRPWRFKDIIAWHVLGENVPGAETLELAAVPNGNAVWNGKTENSLCFASPAVQRAFKKLVRRQENGGNCVLRNVTCPLCDDPSHADRPGNAKLPHTALGTLFAGKIWANRQLDRRGGSLQIALADNSPYCGSAAAKALAAKMRPLLRREPEL